MSYEDPQAETPSKTPQKHSRRTAIVNIAALVLGATDVTVHLHHVLTEQAPPGPYFSAPLRHNGVEITALVTEHDQNALNQVGAQIARFTQDFDIIVPEYFPPEYAGTSIIDEAARFAGGDTTNALFYFLAEQFAANKQNIWVVDPAYSARYGVFWAEMGLVAGGLIGGAATTNLRNGRGDLPHPLLSANAGIKRRAILRFVSAALGGTSLFLGLDNGLASITQVEDLFREAVDAEHLKSFASTGIFPSGSKVLLICPQGHWANTSHHVGIQRFFEDDALRGRVLADFKPLQVELPDLFLARHYPDGRYDPNRQTIEIGSLTTDRTISVPEQSLNSDFGR